MRHTVCITSVLLAALCHCAVPPPLLAQRPLVPRDGTFHVESRPAFTFQATLTEDWVCPHAGDGILRVYAPVLPELPGQRKVSTRLYVVGEDRPKARDITERSIDRRPMLALDIKSNQLAPSAGISLRLRYVGTLFARTLRRGAPPRPVPDLAVDERRRYLMASTTMDHTNREFRRWMTEHGLKRQKDEDSMRFAYRVFTHFIDNAHYGGDTSSYEKRRPSQVCKSFANDCGGLALLFVAVMRANDVPARTLFGRWAIPQTDSYGQYHVIAEFFVDKSGWVPVDIAGTLVHKPKDSYAFFGNTDGQFLAFHIDTDLEPAGDCRHGWAQYLLVQWQGTGDAGRDQHVESKWEVARRPARK
jgi:hypothetical protein